MPYHSFFSFCTSKTSLLVQFPNQLLKHWQASSGKVMDWLWKALKILMAVCFSNGKSCPHVFISILFFMATKSNIHHNVDLFYLKMMYNYVLIIYIHMYINISRYIHIPWLPGKFTMLPARQKIQLNRNLVKKAVKLALDDLKEKYKGILLSAHALKVKFYLSLSLSHPMMYMI